MTVNNVDISSTTPSQSETWLEVEISENNNMFMCKKSKAFLQTDINLFKIITNKIENCIKVFLTSLIKLLLAAMATNAVFSQRE